MSEEEGYLERAIYRLDHCATNDAAHFGGPHGMFVDVPVRDLKAVITQLRLLQGAQRDDRAKALSREADLLEEMAAVYPGDVTGEMMRQASELRAKADQVRTS